MISNESSETDILLAKEKAVYKTSPYRFMIIILYTISITANLALAMCFTPLQLNLQHIFGKSVYTVNLSTRILQGSFTPFFNLMTNFILDKYGLRAGVILGNLATIAALWVSSLCRQSFYFLLAGQILVSLGHGCLVSVPQKVSVVWFAPNERVLSTTAMSLSVLLGFSVGAQFPNFFVEDGVDGDEGLKQIEKMLYILAIAGTAMLIPTFFMFRDKPKYPPSKAAEVAAGPRQESYAKSFVTLFKNKNSMLLSIGGTLILAPAGTLQSILQLLLDPYHFKSSQVGNYLTLILILGVPGAIALGVFVSKTQKYKVALLVSCVLNVAVFVAIMFLMRLQNNVIMLVAFGVFGFVSNSFYPVLLELLCEVSFPVSEVVAGTLLYLISQLCGDGLNLITDTFLETTSKENTIHSFYFLIAVSVVGLVFMCLAKEDLKRSQLELSETDCTSVNTSFSADDSPLARTSRDSYERKDSVLSSNSADGGEHVEHVERVEEVL